MKKILIGTSALVAAVSLAGVASAAEPIKLSVGGFGSGYVAYASQKDDFLKDSGIESNAVDVKGDNEIHFKGKTTLDNGLTVAVRYELEAGGADQGNIDDVWSIETSGAFGTIALAADSTATDKLSIGAGDYGVKVLGGQWDNDLPKKLALLPTGMSTGLAAGSITTTVAVKPIDNDAESISYYTPAIYGFTLGGSYHGSSESGNDNVAAATTSTTANADDAYTVGLQWKHSFNDVSLGFAGGYGVRDPKRVVAGVNSDNVSKYDEWGLGGQVGYRGFTVGGRYKAIDIDNGNTVAIANGTERKDLDKTVWEAGIGYEANPYVITLNYQSSEAKQRNVGEDKDKLWQIQLTGQYTMGPGVKLEAAVAYVNLEDGQYDTATTNKDQYKNESWVVGTGLSLQF